MARLWLGLFLVLFASGCAPRLVARATPTDPEWKTKYWGLVTINAEPIWSTSTGAGVRVAVIDTGTELLPKPHPDLRTVAPPTGSDLCTSGSVPDDETGHGTEVNGVIAGAADGAHTLGVAWSATLLPYKVACPQNFNDTHAVKAVAAALDLSPGVHIIHGSWPILPGGASGDTLAGLITGKGRNVLFVFAAPTFVPTIPAYASEINVIVVTGAGRTDDPIPHFPADPLRIHVAAPGVEIRTADIESQQYGTDNFSGPSAAAAFVSGCAALIKAQFPNLTGPGLKARILANALPVGQLMGAVQNGRRLDCGAAFAGAR